MRLPCFKLTRKVIGGCQLACSKIVSHCLGQFLRIFPISQSGWEKVADSSLSASAKRCSLSLWKRRKTAFTNGFAQSLSPKAETVSDTAACGLTLVYSSWYRPSSASSLTSWFRMGLGASCLRMKSSLKYQRVTPKHSACTKARSLSSDIFGKISSSASVRDLPSTITCANTFAANVRVFKCLRQNAYFSPGGS